MSNPARARNVDLDAALAEAEETYVATNPKSREHYAEARRWLSGGVARSSLYFAPFPLVFARGQEQYIWDVDDHRYLDFMGDYTAGIFGHSHPLGRRTVGETFETGIALNGPHRFEAPFAKLLCQRFPCFEQVRFCNSGTEANLFALSLARAVTGRDAVMVFDGSYHGGVFNFTKGDTPVNYPIPWVRAPYNDIDGTRGLIEAHAAELAAILIEPMVGASGCIPADTEFLEALRAMASEHGIVLVFDEVMTARLGPNGFQGITGVTPDLTTISKFLGGGLTFGAFGGRADLMARYDQERDDSLPQSGTFNNNVLTMEAGRVALSEIYTADVAIALNARGDDLRQRLNDTARRHGVAMQFTGMGSMMNVHFTEGPIRAPGDAGRADPRRRDLFHFDLMAQGMFLARSGMVALSLPMTDADSDALVAAIDEFCASRAPLLQDVSGN